MTGGGVGRLGSGEEEGEEEAHTKSEALWWAAGAGAGAGHPPSGSTLPLALVRRRRRRRVKSMFLTPPGLLCVNIFGLTSVYCLPD